MYDRILVPLKGDDTDEAVVAQTGSLARLSGGKVTLLRVVHSHSRDEATFFEEQARTYLDGQVARLAAAGVTAEGRVASGEPAPSDSRGRARAARRPDRHGHARPPRDAARVHGVGHRGRGADRGRARCCWSGLRTASRAGPPVGSFASRARDVPVGGCIMSSKGESNSMVEK